MSNHPARRLLRLSASLSIACMCASAQTLSAQSAQLQASKPAPAVTPATTTDITTTGGVNGYLPVFTGASTAVDSIVYQGTAGIGIGRIPNAMLDVNGKSIFRGGQVLSRVGDATTSAGAASFGLIVQSSVFNTSTNSNLLPYYQLQSEPTGNNTAATGATYNFLYYSGQGANPAETGLYFNPNGTIHFSPSQTFPIAAGPQGPAGATGATGPVGSQGPAGTIALPYVAASKGNYVFNLTNNGTTVGGGLIAQGAPGSNQSSRGGVGVTGGGGSGAGTTGLIGGPGIQGLGGPAGSEDGASGGTGVEGQGSDTLTPGTFGGDGGDFFGGQGHDEGGIGLFAQGADGLNGAEGGDGISVFAGKNGNYAGFFYGNVEIIGNISKSGGSFKIDHPLDPANKYLYHSFVESPDMKNVYDGTVVTDGSGTALVSMPDYFEALNRDYRYQLTAIGQPAQAYVASEISNGSFVIKTDKPGVKVSWQVTGIRQDAWANAHRIPTTEDKPEKEKGHFTHPELFGHAGEPSIAEMKHPRPARVRQQ